MAPHVFSDKEHDDWFLCFLPVMMKRYEVTVDRVIAASYNAAPFFYRYG